MIKAFVSDFSRVLLQPKDLKYAEGLNALHKKLTVEGEYDFWQHFELNRELLEFYKTLTQRVDVCLFTSEYIQEHPALQPELDGVFKQVFSAARLGLKKSNAETYKTIAAIIGLEPGEILYMDDKQSNIDAAREAGMAVIWYECNGQAIEAINKALA